MYRLLFVVAVVFCVYQVWTSRPVSVADGILVAQAPLQRNISTTPIQHAEFTLSPVADFDITARVLSKENYHADASAKLVKTDLALGWGRMSDTRVIDALNISQSNRFFYWRYQGQPPIPTKEIISSASNMHLIPATPWIQDQLDKVRKNQVLRLTGKLVNASSTSGFRWNTSTSRTDTGAGACELFYVEGISFL